MLKIKEIYALPSTRRALSEFGLREEWIPEVESLSFIRQPELAELETEGRLVVRELIHRYSDGRLTEMCTVWFDNEPVFITQNAGRGGRDHHQRWLTNAPQYWALVAYLHQKLQPRTEDLSVVDPESEVFEEEVFSFYGQDFAEQFGHHTEPKTKGYLLLRPSGIVEPPVVDLMLVEVSSTVESPSEFIRRDGSVLQLYRALNGSELASNDHLDAGGINGTDRYFWYAPCSRPLERIVVSV